MLTTSPPPDDDALAAALAGALARGELSLAWQPQLDLAHGRITGAEALLRWFSPQWGLVAPSRFVPLAEASGLIHDIGRWVLQQACGQAATWLRLGLPALRVAVNVSALQLGRGGLAQQVQDTLAAHGLAPSQLGVEVTETALVREPERAAAELQALQALGVEVALDDFGTGYSSLGLLRTLPVDLVKIDRSFVHDVTAAAASASMTRSIIRMAHELRLAVLAEGVETADQLALLLDNGCDRIQGHVFSPALPAAQFAQLLLQGAALPPAQTRQQARRRTLLLVDDEENILSALRRLVRRDGYQVLTATSAEQALELLAAHPVDVILSDQRMPGMSGTDLLRRAKALRPETVRLTLSGYTDLQSIIDAVNEGAVYKFLTKPWDDERLREHLADAFRLRELTADNQRLSHDVTLANNELARANRRLSARVAAEHDQVRQLQAVAGDAHDLVDALPAAVFGVDPDHALVFVNRQAVATLPQWACDLGADAHPQLLALLAALPDEARAVTIDGQPFLGWRRPLGAGASARGEMLVVMPLEVHPCPLT